MAQFTTRLTSLTMVEMWQSWNLLQQWIIKVHVWTKSAFCVIADTWRSRHQSRHCFSVHFTFLCFVTWILGLIWRACRDALSVEPEIRTAPFREQLSSILGLWRVTSHSLSKRKIIIIKKKKTFLKYKQRSINRKKNSVEVQPFVSFYRNEVRVEKTEHRSLLEKGDNSWGHFWPTRLEGDITHSLRAGWDGDFVGHWARGRVHVGKIKTESSHPKIRLKVRIHFLCICATMIKRHNNSVLCFTSFP